MTGDTGQYGAAIVDLADNKSTDKCQQGMLRRRTPHAADLSEYGEARPNSGLNMRRHGSVSVEVHAKIPDEGNRQNGSGADSGWHSRDLMLMTTGRAPKDFSLGSVELQPIGAHHFIKRRQTETEGEFINVIRPTESVNLGVVGIGVWGELALIYIIISSDS